MILYIVSYDGFIGGFGIELYILGVYDDPDKAIAAKESFDKEYEQFGIEADIQEVVLNEAYDVKVKPKDSVTTSIFLGGYIE